MAKIASKTVSEDAVTIAFSNEKNLSVSLDSLSPEIQKQLALHGLSQKLGDSYAGCKGDVDEAVKLATSVSERLSNGEFNAKREGSGVGRVTALARAVAEITGHELAETVAMLDERTKEEKKELRKNPRVEAVMARMKAEEAAEKLEKAGESAELTF